MLHYMLMTVLSVIVTAMFKKYPNINYRRKVYFIYLTSQGYFFYFCEYQIYLVILVSKRSQSRNERLETK